eukprot:TRINITY_DN92_c0_g1_i2.p1 TRINITY_DN92_c0_g1~~TRINITY_DN92_c0_g1_i2.p1  ORF type:complete len:263 (-),score=3.90 TRINITY_DN92_c0_g1_i2:55-741(-)
MTTVLNTNSATKATHYHLLRCGKNVNDIGNDVDFIVYGDNITIFSNDKSLLDFDRAKCHFKELGLTLTCEREVDSSMNQVFLGAGFQWKEVNGVSWLVPKLNTSRIFAGLVHGYKRDFKWIGKYSQIVSGMLQSAFDDEAFNNLIKIRRKFEEAISKDIYKTTTKNRKADPHWNQYVGMLGISNDQTSFQSLFIPSKNQDSPRFRSNALRDLGMSKSVRKFIYQELAY